MRRSLFFSIILLSELIYMALFGFSEWSTTKRLTWNPGSSRNPSIAKDSGDNIHVVWYDSTPGNPEIYYMKSPDGGLSWGSAKKLTSNSGQSQYPAIAIGSNDNIHLLWCDDTPGNFEIYYMKSSNGGSSWSGAKRLTWNSGGSKYPAIVIDSYNHLHIVWEDSTPGNPEIYYKKSTDGGVSWSSTKRLTCSSSETYFPAIAIDSANNLHFIWCDNAPGNYEIYYKKGTDGGVTWSSAKRLTWNSGDSVISAMTIDSDNNLHLVWWDNTPGNWEIYYKKGK